MANTVGLTVFAQLDADPAGAAYFPRAAGWAVPVVDYAYSAVLVLSLLSQSALSLKDHINRTKALPCDALRPPRTHDGILLQSDQLTQEEFREIVALATQWHLPVRIVNGDAYELNSSFPFICNLGVSSEQGWSRLLLSLAVTAILPGIPYLYLPMLANHQPETTHERQDGDPRSLNRTRLSFEFLQASLQGASGRELRKVLTDMATMQSHVSNSAINATTTGGPSGDSALLVHNHESRWTFVCNLSTADTVTILTPANSKLICSRNAKGNCVSPLGYGFWIEDDQ
ncbi:hypothetical protein [Maricaulis sp.]|uniref:hypothetical protein n=1 Tax=Maricaulis sp. TaxID=1486257 RepID=UPI0032999E6F